MAFECVLCGKEFEHLEDLFGHTCLDVEAADDS